MDLKKYCEYVYHSLYIPIYLYEDKELAFSIPAQEQNTYPPSLYLSGLLKSDKKVTYTLTSFYSYYGCIHLENSNSCIVIGPINDFPYSHETMLSLKKEFSIDQLDAEVFTEFFNKIPQQNLDTFINTLLMINYTLNHTELTRQDIDDAVGYKYDSSINKKYSAKSYNEKEAGLLNNNHEIERELLRYIETGNIEKINHYSYRNRNIKVGIMAHDNLRQWKNTCICLVTLASRAAIRGGLTPSIAYPLSDIYIQQVERLTDLDAIMSLAMQVQLDYTNRVANSIIPPTADHILHQVIHYVRENINKHITVTDVANHVGFTRTSLSRKVKKELGIEMSAFIRRCKLEEAMDLLAFSDKSISEISNYLCFSSQSHFQKAFKDYFEVTPQAYRKSV